MNAAKLRVLLDRIRNPRILVVGDLILDRYVTGEVRRISPEAPIPVLTAISDDERLGGAGNVAANLRAMQAYVEVVGVVGDDGRGRQMKELFDALGVDSSGCMIDATRPTIMKTRLISGVQQMMRVDWESPTPINDEYAETVVQDIARRVQHANALILSDYGKGFLTKRVLEGAIGAARARNIPILVDPKGGDYGRYRGATLVTPNRREAEEAVGWAIDRLDRLPQAAFEIIERAGLGACVITLGAEGMFFRSDDGTDGRVPTQARAVFDVTGAGDTVIGHVALGLASGLPLGDAVALANHAAGIVVGKRGACSVTRNELATALSEGQNQGKVLAETDLDQAVATWRKEGRRVVFTNGCFDVVHPGHIDYLRFAASKGDILIVGINDDASVSRAKGPGRPICVLKDRMEVLAALEMVDAVVPFADDTPLKLIQRITPDVLVKGEDWREKGVVGREWVESNGGLVHLAPLVPGRSTSGIVERIRGTDTAQSGRHD